PEHFKAIWEANKNAWKDVWDYAEEKWDDASLEKFTTSSRFCPDLWQVAWKGQQLAGMVLNYVVNEENKAFERKRGHTEYVYVGEEFRGIGLAKALMARSLRVLKDIGMEEATLGTEVENPHDAMRIYEGMGFRLVKQFTWYQKPVFPGP
ncbi:MAG TPA: GNAT family N-acetyltransferase, partial [Thermoplasmata archaeon]|nr:GNAT family N-acetyltransferase [Thermoplasmata archaeon]